MKFVILFSILFSSVFAQANLSGDWTGFGTWKFKGEGEGVRCSWMTMKWSETPKTIAIESGFYDCDIVTMRTYRTEWSIQDGKLFDENQKEVGFYNGTELQVYTPGPNATTTIVISVKRTASHYDYQEVWFNAEQKIYVIEARFFTEGQ